MRLNQVERISLIMVTHDPTLQTLANRVVHMHDGKVFQNILISPKKELIIN